MDADSEGSKKDVFPAPLIPRDVDLRGMPFMPLDTVRLLDSDLFALSTGDEFKAALTLWCKAWQQVPAASLPNDDKILASLSGAGPRWKKLRDVALRGFVLCHDGRFYHPLIAEKAVEAWEFRQKQRTKGGKRWPGKGRPDPGLPGIPPGYPDGDPAGNSDSSADNSENFSEKNRSLPGQPINSDLQHSDSEIVSDQRPDHMPRLNRGSTAAMPISRDRDRDSIGSKKGRGKGTVDGGPILGSTMTFDWQLPDRWREWTENALNWSSKHTVQFSLYFRDKCLEKGIVSKDWFATWRVWCNRQDGYNRERAANRA